MQFSRKFADAEYPKNKTFAKWRKLFVLTDVELLIFNVANKSLDTIIENFRICILYRK